MNNFENEIALGLNILAWFLAENHFIKFIVDLGVDFYGILGLKDICSPKFFIPNYHVFARGGA